MPLSSFQHEIWQLFFHQLQPAFALPDRKKLGGSLLEDEYNKTLVTISSRIAEAKCLRIQLDGWSNCQREGISNFIVNTPAPIFYKLVPLRDNRHIGEYYANLIIEIIEELDQKKFFLICTDNAKSMEKALRIVVEKYDHISVVGCMAHTFHFFVGDLLRIDSLKSFIYDVTTLVKVPVKR